MAILDYRSIEVICPVGADSIVFERMVGTETLGQLFTFDVDLLSADGNIPITDALGKPMTVGLSMGELGERFFNGVVARFSQMGWLGSKFRYRAQLRPWLWLLTRTSNSRIFQNMSVLDVIKQIFQEQGFSGDVDAGTYLHPGDFKPHEYLVQYNETDFNFVSRLMEQEGIYYFFQHTKDKHTLVLQSGPVDRKQVTPGYEVIPLFVGDASSGENLGYEHVSAWSVGVQIEPGGVALREFDFKNAGADLASAASAALPGSKAAYEIFQYPGLYIDNEQRSAYAARRLGEEQLGKKLVRGVSNARGLMPGNMFTLSEHPAASQNASYLTTSVTYDLESNDYESGAGSGARDFSCVFEAIDASTTYLSPPATVKPRVEGPQTAIVVGAAGDEITTDNFGRVKVQFHWDREGKNDENSSCWVRVSQAWAGSSWGGIHIPRLGQEVIVDFLEGDPDRPIITGRVYNSNNMPPYALPDNKTQSGIKSRSTKDGAPSNFNEIRFEDKKGSEELFMQAEKNQTTTVKKDRSASVGGNDSLSVSGDRSVSIDGNLSVTVKGGGKSANHSALSVTGKHNLHASDTIEVDAPTHIQLTCGGSSILIEPGKISLTAGGKALIVLDANVLAQSSAGTKVVLDANALVQSSGGSKVVLDANALLKASGGGQVALDSNALMQAAGGANVTVDGTKIQVAGQSEVNVAAGSGSIKASGPGVEINGAMVKVNG